MPNGKVETVVKVRGFSLNFHASQQLNFRSMRRMVKGFAKAGRRDSVSIVMSRIETVPITHEKVTKLYCKKYRVMYDKRRLLRDYTTLPYGF